MVLDHYLMLSLVVQTKSSYLVVGLKACQLPQHLNKYLWVGELMSYRITTIIRQTCVNSSGCTRRINILNAYVNKFTMETNYVLLVFYETVFNY